MQAIATNNNTNSPAMTFATPLMNYISLFGTNFDRKKNIVLFQFFLLNRKQQFIESTSALFLLLLYC